MAEKNLVEEALIQIQNLEEARAFANRHKKK